MSQALTREMLELLDELAGGPDFYGSLDLKVEDGVVILVRKGQSIKVAKPLTDTRYSGTIRVKYEAGHLVHAEKVEKLDIT